MSYALILVLLLAGCAAGSLESQIESYKRLKADRYEGNISCKIRGRNTLDDSDNDYDKKSDLIGRICDGMFPAPKKPEGYCE